MVKIFSPFRGPDPIASTLDSLGKQLFGDNTASSLNNEKLYDAQRQNVETDALMDMIAKSGAQTLGADPIAQARLMASGYDPSKFIDIGLMGSATGFGPRDPRTGGWQVAAGQPFDNTADAFDVKAAETARNNNMASADRRYGVDKTIGQKMFEFLNIGADQAVDNAETARAHNMESADRLYGDNLTSKDRRYSDDLASADRRYGVDQSQATERTKFFEEPKAVLLPNGSAGYARQGELANGLYMPILSETDQKGKLLGDNWNGLPDLNPQQQEVLGARVDGDKRGTPRNYVVGNKSYITYDGVNDAQSGAPLPPGGYIGTVDGSAGDVGLTNSTQSGVQQAILANNKLSSLLTELRAVAQKDPTNFGIPGYIKGVAQDAQQIAQGLATGLGYQDAEVMLGQAIQGAAKNGIDPTLISGVFDPDLSSLHTLSDLVVYSAAEALAGQSGRSVSDKDVEFFKRIVGDPQSWMMSQQKYLAKLTQIERILKMNQGTLANAQTNGAMPAPGTTNPPGATAAPAAAPAPAPAATTVEKWIRGPNGQLMKAQ